MAFITTCLILTNLIGLVLANLDPNFGSDFGSNFGTLFGLPNPINELNSTSNPLSSESSSTSDLPKSSALPGSEFGLNPSFGSNSEASIDSDYLNGQDARNLNAGLSYPSVNYNAKFATDPDPPDPDNCTINPCLHGFCLLNQSNPLGYACFCKDGFTGFQCQIHYDECKPDYCKNGATCVHEDRRLVCYCRNGYKGKYCEELIDNCASSPCLNGGSCRNFVNGFECVCEHGFYGTNCEKDIDVCRKDTCQNNGTCVEGVGHNYTCRCAAGFEGEHCEQMVNRCKTNPCENHGQCVPVFPGNFTCNCPCDYTGRYCENRVLFCKEKNYCRNGGVCVVEEEHLSKLRYRKNVCYCPPSYYGDRCEFHYVKCLSSMLICENNGTCVDSDDPSEPFRCSCKDGFSGKYCELDCNQTGDCPITTTKSQVEATPFVHPSDPTPVFSSSPRPDLVLTSSDPNEASTVYFSLASADLITPTPSATRPGSPFPSVHHHPPDVGQPPDAPYFNVTEERKEDQNGHQPKVQHTSENSPSMTPKTRRIFSPKFNGLSSLLQFTKDKYELPTSFMLHFDFSTSLPDGVLFHTEADPILFAVVYLEGGLLKLSFSCNQKSTLYLISDKHHQLNNSQIHHVQMHFKLDLNKGVCESQIQLNNSLSINKNQTSSIPANSKVCFKLLNFGNAHSNNPFIPHNVPPLKGCLRSIYINNNRKLVKDAVRADDLEECDPERICELSPCGRHGECVRVGPHRPGTISIGNRVASRFKRANFFADDLDLFGQNRRTYVQPSGRANWLAGDQFADNWECRCRAGYNGTFCELVSCENSPCANQAACLLVSNSELSCICPEFKFGDYCDLDFRRDSPRFSEESYLVLPVENRNDFVEILFNFTTRNSEQANALLLYMGQPQSNKNLDSLSLTIDRLFLSFKISLAMGSKEISAKLADHQNFHQVRLGYSKQFFWLSVDSHQKVEDQLFSFYDPLLAGEKLHVGGHHLIGKADKLADVNFFEGCIFNVSVRTSPQNSTFSLMQRIITNYGVDKCPEDDCK